MTRRRVRFTVNTRLASTSTSAGTSAWLERLAERRFRATWRVACHARDVPDFRLLCEIAGLDASRDALAAVRAANRRAVNQETAISPLPSPPRRTR